MATNVEKVRLLIRDNGSPQKFSDSELQTFLDISKDMNGGDEEEVFLAAAFACDALANQDSILNANSISLGDYTKADNGKQADYRAMADQFRKYVYETPAFYVAEINSCSMQEIEIIRNQILREL